MQTPIENSATKKPTNVSINKDLLDQARSLNINLSATLEQALSDKIRQAKRQQWLDHNRGAIEACNQLAEKNGLFSDKHSVF